jgi:hypothetical protein
MSLRRLQGGEGKQNQHRTLIKMGFGAGKILEGKSNNIRLSAERLWMPED